MINYWARSARLVVNLRLNDKKLLNPKFFYFFFFFFFFFFQAKLNSNSHSSKKQSGLKKGNDFFRDINITETCRSQNKLKRNGSFLGLIYDRTWHSQNKLKRNGSFLGLIYNETWYSQNRLKRNSSLSGLNITRLVAFRKVVQSVTEGKNENKRNIYCRPIVKKLTSIRKRKISVKNQTSP